jgi:hypothetical protein
MRNAISERERHFGSDSHTFVVGKKERAHFNHKNPRRKERGYFDRLHELWFLFVFFELERGMWLVGTINFVHLEIRRLWVQRRRRKKLGTKREKGKTEKTDHVLENITEEKELIHVRGLLFAGFPVIQELSVTFD